MQRGKFIKVISKEKCWGKLSLVQGKRNRVSVSVWIYPGALRVTQYLLHYDTGSTLRQEDKLFTPNPVIYWPVVDPEIVRVTPSEAVPISLVQLYRKNGVVSSWLLSHTAATPGYTGPGKEVWPGAAFWVITGTAAAQASPISYPDDCGDLLTATAACLVSSIYFLYCICGHHLNLNFNCIIH